MSDSPFKQVPDSADFTVSEARYSKGNYIVRCPSANGLKSRAARLIGDGLNCRYTGREKGYVASPSKLVKFQKLYAAGWDPIGKSAGGHWGSKDRPRRRGDDEGRKVVWAKVLRGEDRGR